MSGRAEDGEAAVGPVLCANALGQAVLAAIVEMNPGVRVSDRGAYYRVLAPGCCRLRSEAVERLIGRPFELPVDLEAVMPSFQGELRIEGDSAVWS